MLDLLKIRDQIDEIDNEILTLFEKRMQLAEEVAAFKIETGKPVFDKERELSKLSVLREKSSTPFNANGVQELFQQIMSISRKRQYQLLTEHELFDIYRGKGVAEGKKSLAFSLELRADDRTLTDADCDTVTTKVLTALKDKLNAELR